MQLVVVRVSLVLRAFFLFFFELELQTAAMAQNVNGRLPGSDKPN